MTSLVTAEFVTEGAGVKCFCSVMQEWGKPLGTVNNPCAQLYVYQAVCNAIQSAVKTIIQHTGCNRYLRQWHTFVLRCDTSSYICCKI